MTDEEIGKWYRTHILPRMVNPPRTGCTFASARLRLVATEWEADGYQIERDPRVPIEVGRAEDPRFDEGTKAGCTPDDLCGRAQDLIGEAFGVDGVATGRTCGEALVEIQRLRHVERVARRMLAQHRKMIAELGGHMGLGGGSALWEELARFLAIDAPNEEAPAPSGVETAVRAIAVEIDAIRDRLSKLEAPGRLIGETEHGDMVYALTLAEHVASRTREHRSEEASDDYRRGLEAAAKIAERCTEGDNTDRMRAAIVERIRAAC